MGYSISDAVSEVLEELHPLEYAFKHKLVNYSALGRFIKPAVEKRMKGESVGLDAIIMAIRRNADVLERAKPEAADLYDLLSECKLVLRTGMVDVHFNRSEELFSRLVKLEERIDWASGEKMYVLQRTDELSVISMSKYLPDLLELVKGDGTQLLEKQENLALLTVSFPLAALYTSGFMEFISHQFSALGVSVIGVFSSYSKISFLFDESEAASVYEKLTTSIKQSREFARAAGKKEAD